MATEESNDAEFQEKTGLKRKLTGPPRLLLGKSRSPGQEERKSRKHRRHNEDADDTPMDAVKDEQSPEPHEQTSPEPPEILPTTEPDGATCTDPQEHCLETNLEQNTKKRRRRSKAGATIRRIFSCVQKRKAVEDTEEITCHKGHITIQDKELLTPSGDSLKMKKPVKTISSRKFRVRMWHVFRKRSSTSKQEVEEHEEEQCNDTFTEISSETGPGQQIPSKPAAIEDQQNESSQTVEGVTGICEENCLETQGSKNEVLEMGSLNVDMNIVSNAVFVHESESHQHPPESDVSCLADEEIQMSEASLTEVIESDSNLEDPRSSPEDPVGTDDMLVDVPVFKCKPIITIEDVHSSDEENSELFENVAPRYGTLSPLLSLNGSCYTLKTPERRFSEILLAQTALSLVRAAISGAVEQLSAELQNRQMDQDRV